MRRPAKPVAVLAITAVVLALGAVGFLVVAKVTSIAMKRLGLELWSVLFWFGLADAPQSELVVRNLRRPRHRGNAASPGRLPLPENL